MGSVIDVSEALLELGLSSTVTDEERAIVNASITRAEGAVKRYLKYDPVQRTRTEFYPQADRNLLGRFQVWEVDSNQAVLRHLSEAATDQLQVQHIPIRSITTLSIDFDGRSGAKSGSFPAETDKVEGTDFWPNYDGQDSSDEKICRDGIVRSIGAWPTSPGTVKIIYVAGYTSAELHGQDSIVDASPIMDAVLEESVRRAKKAFVTKKKTSVGFLAGVVTSEKLGDYAYTLDANIANQLFGSGWDVMPENMQKLEDFVNLGWTLGS